MQNVYKSDINSIQNILNNDCLIGKILLKNNLLIFYPNHLFETAFQSAPPPLLPRFHYSLQFKILYHFATRPKVERRAVQWISQRGDEPSPGSPSNPLGFLLLPSDMIGPSDCNLAG